MKRLGRLEVAAVGCGVIFYAGLAVLLWRMPGFLVVLLVVFGGAFLAVQWEKLEKKKKSWIKAAILIALILDAVFRQGRSIPAQIISGTLNGLNKVLEDPPTSNPDMDYW